MSKNERKNIRASSWSPPEKKRERKSKQKKKEEKKDKTSIHHPKPYLITTGTAKKLPTTTQLIKKAITADLTTISHWARTITGLNTLVKGTANAGTAFINRKRLRTLVSTSSMSSASFLTSVLDDSRARGVVGDTIADDDADSSGMCFSRTKLEGEGNACVSSAIRLWWEWVYAFIGLSRFILLLIDSSDSRNPVWSLHFGMLHFSCMRSRKLLGPLASGGIAECWIGFLKIAGDGVAGTWSR